MKRWTYVDDCLTLVFTDGAPNDSFTAIGFDSLAWRVTPEGIQVRANQEFTGYPQVWFYPMHRIKFVHQDDTD